MNLNKLLVAAAAALALGATSASAAVVGGVDFGPFDAHLDTTTLAETLITGDGQVLRGYGQVNTVNGNSNYTGDASKLYFYFEYTSQNFTGTSVEFTGGTIDIYKGTLGNLLLTDSETNVANITGLSEWARLTGHGNMGGGASASAEIVANGTLTGSTVSFTGSGQLDVDTSGAFGLASVADFLDGNSIMDAIGGFYDIAITTSGNNFVLNPNDDLDGCDDGTADAGQWCIAGSADLRGDLVIPEPTSLALVGLGLLGAGVGSLRKRKSA